MNRTLRIATVALMLAGPLFAENDATGNVETADAKPQQEELPEYIRNAPTPKLPENLPDATEMQRQFILLERFLALPPEELKRIRETIERIEAMDPERREEMRQTLRRLRMLDPHEQIFLRQISNYADATERARLETLWRELPRDQRTLLAERLQQLPESERRSYLDAFAATSKVPPVSPEADSEATAKE